jgi:hypothetical protein
MLRRILAASIFVTGVSFSVVAITQPAPATPDCAARAMKGSCTARR